MIARGKGAESRQHSIVAVAAIIASLCGLSSCRSKLEGKVIKNGKSAAISIDDGVTVQRQFFQSGSVIGLDLNDKIIALGDSFTVLNLTNNEVLVESTTVDPAVPALVEDGYSYQITATGVTLKIYPKANRMKGKFIYGVNLLRIDVVSADGDRFWEWEMTIRDFPVFGPTGAAFSENVPSKGGFSGQFTGVVEPVVRADGGGVLRTGQFHMINH